MTFTGKDYLCAICLEQTQSEATTPATEILEMGSPSKKAKAPLTHSTPRGQDSLMDTQLSSPMSDMSDISTDSKSHSMCVWSGGCVRIVSNVQTI